MKKKRIMIHNFAVIGPIKKICFAYNQVAHPNIGEKQLKKSGKIQKSYHSQSAFCSKKRTESANFGTVIPIKFFFFTYIQVAHPNRGVKK